MDTVTWEGLKKYEPRLKRLESEILAYRRKDGCINRLWYRELKPKLVRLVGWERMEPGDRNLSTHVAYDVAYQTLFGMFPDCDIECDECQELWSNNL